LQQKSPIQELEYRGQYSGQERYLAESSGRNHHYGIDGALFGTETASHAPAFIIENSAGHMPLPYRQFYMEGLKSAEIDTEHAQGACSSIQYRFRSLFHRHLPNNGATTIGNTTDRTGHATDITINTPNLIDFMNVTGITRNSRNGTDIPAESTAGAVIQNSMGHALRSSLLSDSNAGQGDRTGNIAYYSPISAFMIRGTRYHSCNATSTLTTEKVKYTGTLPFETVDFNAKKSD